MREGLGLLVALTAGYLGLLFLVARLGDRTRLGARLSRHPLVSALSLGVYATSWSYHGSVGFAAREGWRFLAIYVGLTLSCALVPVIWAPLARLARERQLSTLADVFAFRYRSQAAGVVVTLFLLAGSLPYQALQLEAIVRSVEVLTGEGSARLVGLVTCALLIALGMLFGARHLTLRERHDGLVLAIAFESLVKLVALLALGAFAVWGVFGGTAGLDDWLTSHPRVVERMTDPGRDGPWGALLIVSFAAAFLLPRQWHMAFTEGMGDRGLRTASWGLPTYLLLLTLALPPILWAGQKLGLGGSPDQHVLALAMGSGSRSLETLVFLGGLSAASAMILVTTIALAGMCQNHLVLPLLGLTPRPRFYQRLLWMRRGLIALIVMAGYGFYELIGLSGGLADQGLVSFVAVSQFLPGLCGVLFWPRATLGGFLAGLGTGIVLWVLTLLVPLLSSGGVLPHGVDFFAALGVHGDPWTLSTALSLGLNALVFVLVSMRGEQRATETEAAAICRSEAWTPTTDGLRAVSAKQFVRLLAPLLGASVAEAEVRRALADLGLVEGERRPSELWRLRERIEQNLSGLVGPVLAKAAVDETLALDPKLHVVVSDQVRFLETQFAERLRGPARELENARRYLRRILEDLPLGVCTLGPSGDVVLWNAALARLTCLSPEETVGRSLDALAEPWGSLFAEFVAASEDRIERTVGAQWATARRVALGKSAVDPAALPGRAEGESAGLVLLVEDRTDQHAMASRLAHQDRLASIGQLAAGVAHEIGNPLTAIASVAQNLAEETTDADAAERMRLVVESTRRIARILRALVTFSHGGRSLPSAERRPVKVAEIAREAITLARLSKKAKAVDMQAVVPEDLEVLGDPQQLEQVLVNLLTNAADASVDGGVVTLVASVRNQRACIDVIDSGEGMPVQVQRRAFEPFFTTKSPGEGTGLGLALCYSIVLDHGGTIEIESGEGKGTRMSVSLPAVAT